jgi:Domain of unknown function (DUF4136)
VSTAAAQKINVITAPGADFSHVKLYQWRLHPVFEKHPDLKETYATAIQLIMQEGNAELMKQGLQPDDGAPDVFVSFLVQATPETRTTTNTIFESWWGTGYGWYSSGPVTRTTVENLIEGMLVLDIVDARTSKLMWRAYCSAKIDDVRNRDKDIRKAVRKALERFPPKSK